MQQEFITVTFNRTKIAIRCADILYVIMSDDHCRIHMFDGNVYRCRMTLKELKKQLNEEFMEVKRGCMVAVSAISDIGDRILLSNGEKICYTKRKKRVLREELQKNQELIIAKISKKKLPLTAEEYRKYYKIARPWGRLANPAPMTSAPPQRLSSSSKGEEMSSPAIEQSPMSGAHQSQYDCENADAASA